MDDNRFFRAYLDYKKEKEERELSNNRFRCLIEDRCQPPLCSDQDNRFSCLIDDNYRALRAAYQSRSNAYQSRSSGYQSHSNAYQSRSTAYQSRSTINNSQTHAHKTINKKPPFLLNTNYYFPKLPNELNTESKKEIVMAKAVITDPNEILTSITMKSGKLITKEVYKDGTEVSSNNNIKYIIKTYDSWADVAKAGT